MDLVNLKDDIEKLNKETLPELERILKELADKIDQTIKSLDGLTITVNFKKE